MCKEYNGYTNYETWNVNLWLDNEQGLQETMQEMAQGAYDNSEAGEYQTREEAAIYDLSEAIKNFVDELMPEVNGMFADLLQSALDNVNWREIAENYLEEVEHEEESIEE